jgi:hypothetical protein
LTVPISEAPVPTLDDFTNLGPKASAFAGIDDSVKLAVLSAMTARVATYLRKHAKGKILLWDGSFTAAVVDLSALRLMRHRGYKPDAGADSAIKEAAAESLEWLKAVASADVEPEFVDSTPDEYDAGPDGGSSIKSDDWIMRGGQGCGCEGYIL